MKHPLTRRRFLASTVLATGAFAPHISRAAAPESRVLDTRIISNQTALYHGWPTLARRRRGQLVVAYSGGREAHVCPFGRVEMLVSNDDGVTWEYPQVLIDTPIDERDAGVLVTGRGTILVSTFTSLAYEPILEQAEKKKSDEPGAWSAERLAEWRSAHNRLTAAQRREALGQWMIRSTDGGVTWSQRYSSIVNSPHGPIQLSNGRLLYAGKELWTGERRVGVAESLDDGLTWQWLAEIPPRPNDKVSSYHELHAVEAQGGRLICHIRNHNKANDREILQSESTDGGQTWSVPQAIGVWGLPSHLLRLRNGNLLMTYGYRRAPIGNQARVSTDNGRTWSEPMTISSDGTSTDIGYPSTVEMDDGTLLTVWYERLKASPRAVLRQARWVFQL